MQERMEEARSLFRNKDTTEFVIVTIPTAMAAAESGRLAKVRLLLASCLRVCTMDRHVLLANSFTVAKSFTLAYIRIKWVMWRLSMLGSCGAMG